MAEWYFIEDKEPLSPEKNMAVDEYLFNRCHNRNLGFFRIYSWDRPSFSIGVSQKVEKAVALEYIREKGYGFVRRITGGKTVLHDHEITYSVVSSEDTFFRDNDLYKSYALIAEIILQTLVRSGLNATLSDGSPGLLSRSSNPCFSFPTPNEIEVGGKKIVGSAQKRDKQALLQHGSMPLSMNYEIYSRGTGYSERALKKSMTTVSDESSATREELCRNFFKSFEEFIETPVSGYQYTNDDLREIGKLEEKYASDSWNLGF